ncbi:helix-turn-helix domain-containing protein [Acidianus sp. RZ1]|uniref:helix-turn-helix domain-containing protein n=1 Tax=Acidianus sp. RZ1 TaxID=1540082 RepID=UPI001492561B|nr:helix-turn-helix domain-containing protein [Acidianus sp. RZ1]NON61269.1 helix-turn-helix transcriptional regulator [Acidianus sp. RZ1]
MSERKGKLSTIKIKIITFLCMGEASFKEIKDNVNLSTDSLKFHLADLQADGIVEITKKRYHLTKEGLLLCNEYSRTNVR